MAESGLLRLPYKDDLQHVFEYVTLTYGKDYIKIYELGNVGESG